MRYLRYLLFALIQFAIIASGLWLYSAVRSVSLGEINFLSTGFLSLLAFSFVPFIDLISRERKLQIAKLSGTRSNPFLLRSSFHATAEGPLGAAKAAMREICNSVVLGERVFMLAVELGTSSATDDRDFGIGNPANEKNVAAIVVGLQRLGRVELRVHGRHERLP